VIRLQTEFEAQFYIQIKKKTNQMHFIKIRCSFPKSKIKET